MNSSPFEINLFAVPELKDMEGVLKGDNHKKVLLVYELEDEEDLLVTFLDRIFQNLKFTLLKDVLLLGIKPGASIPFSEICRERDIKYLIAFGLPPSRMGININHFKYYPLQLNDKTLLFADSLAKIKQERDNKGNKMSGELWKALKSIFS